MAGFSVTFTAPMITHQRKFNKADVVPVVVICLCLLNLGNGKFNFAIYSQYLSVFGLLAAVVYFYARYTGRVLFIIWAVAQILLVRSSGPAAATVIDLSQGVSLPVYFPVTIGNTYQPGINLAALILLALTQLLRSNEIIGESVHFSPYRYDNSLGEIFPLTGKVVRQVCLSGEKDWLLVNIETPFKFNDNLINYVLIMRNDKNPVVKNQINQLVFFKPVPDIKVLDSAESDKRDFKDEVWALCR